MQRFIRGEWIGTGQYPFWMTHNSKERGGGRGRSGKDPGELKNKTFPGEACFVLPTHLPPRSVRLGRSFRKSVSIYPTSALRRLNQGPWVMVQCQENLRIWIFSRLSHQIAAPLLWRSHFTTYNILNARKTLSFSLVKKKRSNR